MAIANGGNDMDKNEVLKILETAKDKNGEIPMRLVRQAFEKLPESCEDTISRQAAIDAIYHHLPSVSRTRARTMLHEVPSVQPEIIRCKDCKFGEQDEVGRWFCRSLGCQIGNEDGSGFCADAERRTDE